MARKAGNTEETVRFNIVMARSFLADIDEYAARVNANKAELIRDAVRADMRNRDKFGADYDVVMSLLERIPTQDVINALTDARRSL